MCAEKLTSDVVLERLRVSDSKLIDTIYDLAREQVTSESRRTSELDNKGGMLLAMLGAGFSIAFAVGGNLLERVLLAGQSISQDTSWLVIVTWVIWLLALVAFGVAACFSYKAVIVRGDFKGVNEEDIFNTKAMHNEHGDEDAGHYKRFMAAHFREIASSNFTTNERKADYLKYAQKTLLVGLGILLLVALLLTIGLTSVRPNALVTDSLSRVQQPGPATVDWVG